MKNIKFLYGKDGYNLSLPDRTKVIDIPFVEPLKNSDIAIKESIKNPIGTKPLSEILKGKKTACIVISDITRPVPNEEILLPILEILECGGITKKRYYNPYSNWYAQTKFG